jgi:ketosteroid isomerase-like protein
MYKAAVRALVRHGVRRLNEGDPSFLLRLASRDGELAFPGDNSWASMFRPVVKGRECHVTHRGYDECQAFADRFVANKVQFVIEDILVNGPPWHTRIALRVHDFVAGEPGEPDVYNNRAVAFIELRWFKLVRWEDYEDCERVAAWDAATRATVI